MENRIKGFRKVYEYGMYNLSVIIGFNEVICDMLLMQDLSGRKPCWDGERLLLCKWGSMDCFSVLSKILLWILARLIDL